MAWLGFVTLLTIYWCFFVAATTGRIGWCLLTGWLLPILALTISFRKGMQVNGLMVLICFVLPAVLSTLFCLLLRRVGWIHEGDMKLPE